MFSSRLLVLFAVGCVGCATVPRVPPPADLPRDRPLQVAFLVVDGVYNTELTAPYDIFHHTQFHAPAAPPCTKPTPEDCESAPRGGMNVFTVSPDGRPVITFEGLILTPDYSFDRAPAIDILVVPSAEYSMDQDLEDARLIEWVRSTGRKAAFIVSLCDGAFVLAKAGLLDGRASTTFPSDVDRYQQMFPQLDVRRGVSFVHDGPALTSQGGAKSFDVAIYLVDHLWGEQVARNVARGLVIPWPLPGLDATVVGAEPAARASD